MKYIFIDKFRSEFPVLKMCHVLSVSRSGFYCWVSRKPSNRKCKNKVILEEIVKSHNNSYQSYGSPRIYDDLQDLNIDVSINTVAKIMKENQIKARFRKKYIITTDSNHKYSIAPNLLNREFNASCPNEKWVSDITFLWLNGKWIYLCVIIDLFSRRVVGWSLSDKIDTDLLIEAFLMAVTLRNPPKGLIFHSDRGVQYASYAFRDLIKMYGMRQSMSRKGNCWDNSCAETFFKSLKSEYFYYCRYTSFKEVRTLIFEYIESFYNTRRKHSYIGYVSPFQYEEKLLHC